MSYSPNIYEYQFLEKRVSELAAEVKNLHELLDLAIKSLHVHTDPRRIRCGPAYDALFEKFLNAEKQNQPL